MAGQRGGGGGSTGAAPPQFSVGSEPDFTRRLADDRRLTTEGWGVKKLEYDALNRHPSHHTTVTTENLTPGWTGRGYLKAAVHWVRVNALSAESSPNLTLAAMGLRAD